MEGFEFQFVGKTLLIKAEGEKILAFGDLHLGYEENLNEAGVFIGRKMYDEMLSYLNGVFLKVGKVDKVVLIGDIKHDFGGISQQEWNDVLGLFDFLKEHCEEIVITKGNHDNYLLNITSKRDFVKVLDYWVLGDVCFMHGHKDFPEIWDKKVKYWVMGHNHPAIMLSDGIKRESYKCFLRGAYKGKEIIMVPSFFDYLAGMDVIDNELKLAWEIDSKNFEVFIIGENLEVLSFGKLKNIEAKNG